MSKDFSVFFKKAFFLIIVICVLVFSFRQIVINPNNFVSTMDNLKTFFETVELKTFDARQKFYAPKRVASKDIVILELDEKTYSIFTEKMGEWPVSRKIYADVIEFIEKDNPLAIGLDLLFINSDKYNKENDMALVDVFNKYDNVFTSISFDREAEDVRYPIALTDKFKIKVDNYSAINTLNFPDINFSNCRPLIDEIMESNVNVGQINVVLGIDGVIRALNPFIIYQDEFYPHLTVKMLSKLLEKQTNKSIDKLTIDKKRNLYIGDKKIPLLKDSSVVLNWYAPNSIQRISFIDVYNAIYNNNETSKINEGFFKDKIIYIGATAVALYDLKNTPIDSSLPGVVLHTTFLNNFFDDDFIVRTTPFVDLIINIVLCFLFVVVTYNVKKQLLNVFMLFFVIISYVFFSGVAMEKYNLWIPLVTPIFSLVLTFMGIYIVKYFKKSKDFEYTYKLATTDGLTELYNHRFFQEQLLLNIENTKRYNIPFSLIIIDIDFFKKFNDKYGHQAGDAVLKQVASILKKQVRATDIVCRYGGEEMTVILTGTGHKEAIIAAQKICEVVASTPFYLTHNNVVNVTISLGVATCPENGIDANTLIEFADQGLYLAKESGRNQVCVAQIK